MEDPGIEGRGDLPSPFLHDCPSAPLVPCPVLQEHQSARSSRTRPACCAPPRALAHAVLSLRSCISAACSFSPAPWLRPALSPLFPQLVTPLLCSHDSPTMTSAPQHFHRSKLLGYQSSSPAELTDSGGFVFAISTAARYALGHRSAQ